MINFHEMAWGRLTPHKMGLIEEVGGGIYELDFCVEEGDVVLDIGASIGIFTASILHKNPSRVFCIEPDINFFKCLVENTRNYQVTCLNNMIGCEVAFMYTGNVVDPIDIPTSLNFQKLLYSYNINKVDFLKIDCEGCEYEFFSADNIFGVLNTVRKIVGELHLGTPELKEKFISFTRSILPLVPNYNIYTIDGVKLTGREYTEDFLNTYTEVIIYIDNR